LDLGRTLPDVLAQENGNNDARIESTDSLLDGDAFREIARFVDRPI
jgi:hypothetical protein